MDFEIRVFSDIPRRYSPDQYASRRMAYFNLLKVYHKGGPASDTLEYRIRAGVGLEEDERAALVKEFGHGCRAATKESLAMFAAQVPTVKVYSLYERVTFHHSSKLVTDSKQWVTEVRCLYSAGQSYPDEIRRVRDLMTSF